MWIRMSWADVRVVCHYLGVLILFSSALMLAPLATAIVFGEWDAAARYLLGMGVSLTIGSLLRLMRIAPGSLNRQNALIVTGLVWIALSLVATVPLSLSGHYTDWLDVFFECVSGYTTTGASVTLDLDHLSYADNMFRFMMHLVGGLGVIVVALSLGLLSKGASNLFSSEAHTDHIVPNVIQTARFIVKLSMVVILAATGALVLFCLLAGMEPARAVLHSFWLAVSGFLTGGFAPTSLSIQYYHSFPLETALMLLMLLGSLSFTIYSEVQRGRIQAFFQDIEVRTMILWLLAMTCVFAASLSATTFFSDLPAMLRRGLFMVTAAFSTTGFQNITSNQMTTAFSSGAFLILAILMGVGGSTGGTSGGIKFLRLGIIFKSVALSIKETIAPDSGRVVVTFNHIGRRILTPDLMREAMTIFVLYIITYAAGALVGIAYGYDATQAVFESVAMTSNGGLTTGIASPGMPVGLEVLYILQMWAGRLEFLTFLALIVKISISIIPRRKNPKPRRRRRDDAAL